MKLLTPQWIKWFIGSLVGRQEDWVHRRRKDGNLAVGVLKVFGMGIHKGVRSRKGVRKAIGVRGNPFYWFIS